ncbi:exosome nuclease subunit [Elasticomyces elasticus]|uniref:Exosome nuclease subunit n=1 Tax=Elasticomyces elasticus TaxID=574655 RepID=A0AAN7ZNL4_9PEZI|nr:exosome nuclease subunit [Elasticomyces elasticus]
MDDFTAVHSATTSALVATTRTAGQLATSDLPFHRSLDAGLSSALDEQNARLLSLAERLLGAATGSSAETGVRSHTPRLSSIESVEGNWRAVVDVVDSLLERADTALDEFTGAVRRLSPGASEQQKVGAGGTGLVRPGRIAAALKNREIEKPQLRFEHVPSNDETGIFQPLLESKPHATQPLKEVGAGEQPYKQEIEMYRFPDSVYTQAEPIPYHPFDSTTATFVDTEEAMYEMLEELKQASEIAVDLEHHDQRSYIGIVSLMQISTRDKDWIVDTLKPWRRKLQCLNEVFANPSILKVLHGAYMDVMWLQRDLGLYLVGLFDTHYACRALGYTGGSLAFLLKKFADVDAQKQYQTADWRIRPLPQELFDYARSDTHYLLYIFDNMRNELIQRSDLCLPDHEGDKLWDVLQKSTETALQRYEHPIYDGELGQGPMGWYKLLARTPALLTKEQFSIFRAAHRWRDNVAREQDDSVHFVLPNHHIFSLAKQMPDTKEGVLNTVHPATQTVRFRIDELLGVVVNAKADGKDGEEMMDVLNRVEPQPSRKAPREVVSHSVAAFLPKVSSPVASGASSALPMRSATSTFWGAVLPSAGRQDRRTASTAAPGISLTVPLPELTAEIFADPPAYTSTPVKPSSPEPMPNDTPIDEEQNDVFILKELGKKRKRAVVDAESRAAMDGMAANNDEVAIMPDMESERAQEKVERRKAKKEAKRAKAAEVAGGLNYDEPAADEEPFDYASAPSILNPPRESREEARERRKKNVDPYAKKSVDVPKPLGRVQKERSGRSMTYKS